MICLSSTVTQCDLHLHTLCPVGKNIFTQKNKQKIYIYIYILHLKQMCLVLSLDCWVEEEEGGGGEVKGE